MTQSHFLIAPLALLLWTCIGINKLAAQDGNGGKPIPQDFTVNFAGGEACSFPISIQVAGKAKPITIPDNRLILAAPDLTATLTNLNEPSKQIKLNITGASHITQEPDGSSTYVVTGRNLNINIPSGVLLSIGEFNFVFDVNNVPLKPITGKGQLIDVCELIE